MSSGVDSEPSGGVVARQNVAEEVRPEYSGKGTSAWPSRGCQR